LAIWSYLIWRISNHKEIQQASALILALPYVAASQIFKFEAPKDLFSKTSTSKGKFQQTRGDRSTERERERERERKKEKEKRERARESQREPER